MTLDLLNAFTVTVVLQSVLWKYRRAYTKKNNTSTQQGHDAEMA